MHKLTPFPRVKALYVKEIGPGKESEINVLKNLFWVQEIVVADYRYRVGNSSQNARYLQELTKQHKLNPDPNYKYDTNFYIDKSLEELVAEYLSNIDCIFIAGSAFDPSREFCLETPTRPAIDIRREQFELHLLKAAKERGIPVLAICAGSWRLANAYGGKTRAIAIQDVERHEQWPQARHPREATLLKPGSMLHGIHVAAQRSKAILFSSGKADKRLGRNPSPNTDFDPQILHVNTTHWRVTVPPEQQPDTEFNRTFETSAIDAKHHTLEAYESKHGAPRIAVQFHPEYTIPQVRQKDETSVIVNDYKTHRSILDATIEAGLTFAFKREMHRELLNRPAAKPRSRLRAKL